MSVMHRVSCHDNVSHLIYIFSRTERVWHACIFAIFQTQLPDLEGCSRCSLSTLMARFEPDGVVSPADVRDVSPHRGGLGCVWLRVSVLGPTQGYDGETD